MFTWSWIICADTRHKWVRLEMHRLARAPDRNADYSTIESAKFFVSRSGVSYGPSKISKIWEQYKSAAPYIFAFYPLVFGRKAVRKSPDEALQWLTRTAGNRHSCTAC